MSVTFDFSIEGKSGSVWWFSAKQKYNIRIDTKTGRASCDCTAGSFKMSGRNQTECKHIIACRKLLEVTGVKK
jgi:hypothetical protein